MYRRIQQATQFDSSIYTSDDMAQFKAFCDETKRRTVWRMEKMPPPLFLWKPGE